MVDVETSSTIKKAYCGFARNEERAKRRVEGLNKYVKLVSRDICDPQCGSFLRVYVYTKYQQREIWF